MSTRIDWDVTRGDTDTLPFVVTFTDPVTGAVSTDITGAEVRLTARLRGAPVLSKANVTAGGADAQILITDALAGELEVYLVATDLPVHLLPSGASCRLDYDLEVIRTDGQKRTYANGTISVLMDQTR